MSASLEWSTPHTIGWHAYSAGTADANNQTIPVYTPPKDQTGTPVAVIGWETPKSTEPHVAGHDVRVDATVKLFALPTFRPGVRDLIDLPDVGQCEVVGLPESTDGNPFEWYPGLTIELRQVTG